MKKILLLAIGSLILLACSREDGRDLRVSAIEGTWKLSKLSLYDGKSKTIIKEEIAEGCAALNTYVFHNDNKFEQISYTDNAQGTGCDKSIEGGTYQYNVMNKILTTDISGEKEVFKIFKQTPSELKIIIDDDTEDVNQDGVNDFMVATLVK